MLHTGEDPFPSQLYGISQNELLGRASFSLAWWEVGWGFVHLGWEGHGHIGHSHAHPHPGGGSGERTRKMTFHHVNEGQENAGELVGAGRCMWALPAPSRDARVLLCQGIMGAMLEHGHCQLCWQHRPRTEAEPQLPPASTLPTPRLCPAGSSWQLLCTARSLELVLNWEREPMC